MRLMQRPQITTMALPRSDTWQAASQSGSDLLQHHEAPFHFLPDVQEFARFMLASPEQLILDITREIDDLDAEERSLAGMGDELGVTFVVRAREKCLNALMKAQEMEQDAALRLHMERKRNLLREAVAQVEARSRREAALVASVTAPSLPPILDGIEVGVNASSSPVVSTPPATGPRNARNKRSLNPPPHSSSSYYFYQAASGANVFLHPLDIRILLAHYGNYASFPNDITAHVTYASETTVDDDLRRRCKYLAHLPEGADVVVIEVDLENVVGPESLKQFDNLLKVRRTRHKERSKKEDKARLRAEEKERDSVFSSLAAPILESGPQWQWESPPISHVNVPDRLFGFEASLVADHTTHTASAAPGAPGAEVTPRAPNPTGNTAAGVWGARSFASAAQSPASARSPAESRRAREEDEWEIDQAWHQLEEAQLSTGGGRGKRGRQKKLVLLGSGAGGRRL